MGPGELSRRCKKQTRGFYPLTQLCPSAETPAGPITPRPKTSLSPLSPPACPQGSLDMPCRLWFCFLDRAHNHPWCVFPAPQLSPRPHISAPLTWRVALPLPSCLRPHPVIQVQYKPDHPLPQLHVQWPPWPPRQVP